MHFKNCKLHFSNSASLVRPYERVVAHVTQYKAELDQLENNQIRYVFIYIVHTIYMYCIDSNKGQSDLEPGMNVMYVSNKEKAPGKAHTPPPNSPLLDSLMGCPPFSVYCILGRRLYIS